MKIRELTENKTFITINSIEEFDELRAKYTILDHANDSRMVAILDLPPNISDEKMDDLWQAGMTEDQFDILFVDSMHSDGVPVRGDDKSIRMWITEKLPMNIETSSWHDWANLYRERAQSLYSKDDFEDDNQ